jgi:HD superfamily phosphohydrolase
MAGDAHRTYEIRCPVYGFVTLNDWECQIISQPAFQRLRRIRQLAWTDYVYPGAMHTRFEHSLGVMHMAGMLYDSIVGRSFDILQSDLGYKEDGLRRHKALVRLAALLHDVGHSPFSHAGEELFPFRDDAKSERYNHEHYSAEIVRRKFADVIGSHPLNTANYGFSANDVADLLEGKPEAGNALFWRGLISGQLDADRMDYLLRDSLHAGVGYGRYDWQRLVNTSVAMPETAEGGPRIGVTAGGWHAAEGLIISRYFMFTQVYFHKTRVIYDHHLQEALADMLSPGGCFPEPKERHLDQYLEWDDWRVLGLLGQGKGGEHGRRLAARDHFREIVCTPETPSSDDLERLTQWRDSIGDLLATEIHAEKSWYKAGSTDVQIWSESPKPEVKPLSTYSSVVREIQPVRQVRLYVRHENRQDALARLNKS